MLGIGFGNILCDEHFSGNRMNDNVIMMWPILAVLGFIATDLLVYYFMIMVSIGWMSRVYIQTFSIYSSPDGNPVLQ
tara:strand:+ start:1971 stop:2201 length:231 start_codon:yes stop_codon:yes gene_type:complete